MSEKGKHIDLENGYLSVEENLVTVDNKRITKSPKTQSGKRSLHIPATLLALLKDMIKLNCPHEIITLADGFYNIRNCIH